MSGQDSLGDQLAAVATSRRLMSSSQVSGLPVARLLSRPEPGSTYYVVTTIDGRGRLSDGSPLRVLGWLPNCSVSVRVSAGAVVVVTRSAGSNFVTRQGHLRLPVSVRHSCQLEAGSRLLVAACPGNDLIAVYPTSVLDTMLLAYQVSLRDMAG